MGVSGRLLKAARMHYLMSFQCTYAWRTVGIPIVGGLEALRRFKPVRMALTDCPHCHQTHVYDVREGILKTWDGHKVIDGDRVA